jgi:DNA-damage-inducible protein J
MRWRTATSAWIYRLCGRRCRTICRHFIVELRNCSRQVPNSYGSHRSDGPGSVGGSLRARPIFPVNLPQFARFRAGRSLARFIRRRNTRRPLTTQSRVATLALQRSDCRLQTELVTGMLSNSMTTHVRSRIEPSLKSRASVVLAECGLNLSDAIRLFLRQVLAQDGLPFEIKAPNAATASAVRQARANLGETDAFRSLRHAAPQSSDATADS